MAAAVAPSASRHASATSSPDPQAAAAAAATDAPLPSPWDGLETSILTDLAKRGLLSTLDSIKEAKTLILDPSLAGPLGLVADVQSLKHHGVERMFWLENHSPAFVPKTSTSASAAAAAAAASVNAHGHPYSLKAINAPTRSVVYICRPEIRWMSAIAEHIRADRAARPSSPLQHTYTVTFVPHRTEPCLQFLDREAVLSDISLLDFGLEFVPLEKDVISLEEDTAWKRIYADGDHTSIFRSAQALMTMQHAYGLFPRIIGKGNLARRLADLLIRQRREHLASDPTNPSLTTPSTSIDSLIIIDRSVDLATPLCTQLTYEGLVDEVVGIRNAHVEVDPALLTGTNQPAPPHPSQPSGSGTPLQMTSAPKKRKHRLDSTTDLLFAEIRDLNFAVVGEKLHRAAKRLNEDYEGRHQAKTVSQIRAFVGKLGGLQNEHASLRLHTGLTEKIMQFTGREEFNRMLEIQQNLVAGLDMNAQQQGIEDMVNEERSLVAVLRLLCLSSIVGPGAGGIKAKNLEFVKREILQTYGYQYLALLLTLQKAAKGGRSSTGAAAAAAAASVNGHAPGSAAAALPAAGSASASGDGVTTTLVFFLGGVTFTEIAALRFMSRQTRNRRFVVATTNTISGDSMIRDLSHGCL
ncbi:uncharacterized protein PFL1_01878 [Pseudozyma flocculosa PF-1]|uniref:uncharacterized protein n=1 Tax=Pseudozyma flocculosa PF-1 TaxID=1277687 RepID=UPI0004560AF0|nr:uncharacterized protein PFL1_01878 [Pseudozyma flocculosa PF-1]EPQ30352.1 hypothetical protein PFL1_01878 [Pseudozyma flocculosa PF-1]